MLDYDFDDDLPIDPFTIWGGLLNLSAYLFCFASRRPVLDGIYLNLIGAVFCGSFAAIFSLWVFLRKKKYHKASKKLATLNLIISSPFFCCLTSGSVGNFIMCGR